MQAMQPRAWDGTLARGRQARRLGAWDDARMKLLVCGGAGFIGSTFVRQRVREHGDEVTVLDKLTYAGREENLQDLVEEPGFRFVRGAIEDPEAVAQAIEAASPEAIVNFAAETHVDRSIAEPDAFVSTHALGTYVLLEAARTHAGATQSGDAEGRTLTGTPLGGGQAGGQAGEHGLRYVQVSTDEVYGSIEEGTFTEESPLAPSSPYSATKAGADLLVLSYFHTYGLPALICRGSNNYGPYQYPEKLIPLMVLNAIHGDSLPVYGDGMQVRNWIHASDFAAAIGHVLAHGRPGEVYNAGGPDEEANMTVVTRIVELTGAAQSQIEHVTDRPGHDRRYSLSSQKVRALGWSPRVRFDDGLAQTVAWYRDNAGWWEPIRSGESRAYYERQYGRPLG
jgi:dTDP-glucose 4,6-dehydratase